MERKSVMYGRKVAIYCTTFTLAAIRNLPAVLRRRWWRGRGRRGWRPVGVPSARRPASKNSGWQLRRRRRRRQLLHPPIGLLRKGGGRRLRLHSPVRLLRKGGGGLRVPATHHRRRWRLHLLLRVTASHEGGGSGTYHPHGRGLRGARVHGPRQSCRDSATTGSCHVH